MALPATRLPISTYGLSFWLPFQGTGCYLYEPYAFRSFYLASFGVGGLTRENTAAQKQAYRECSRIAPLMMGDYYPLTRYSLKQDAWIAWQFDRPDLGMGLVQAFRRSGSPEASMHFKPHGLQRESRYEIEDLDGGGRAVSGKELQEEGLPLTLSRRPGAGVVIYRRLTEVSEAR